MEPPVDLTRPTCIRRSARLASVRSTEKDGIPTTVSPVSAALSWKPVRATPALDTVTSGALEEPANRYSAPGIEFAGQHFTAQVVLEIGRILLDFQPGQLDLPGRAQRRDGKRAAAGDRLPGFGGNAEFVSRVRVGAGREALQVNLNRLERGFKPAVPAQVGERDGRVIEGEVIHRHGPRRGWGGRSGCWWERASRAAAPAAG